MGAQHTISRPVKASGRALQSGIEVEMVLSPASSGTGIVFRRSDLATCPEMRIPENVLAGGPERRSAVSVEGVAVQTVEHLLASLWAMEIDNITIDVSGEELPALGGSAAEYLTLLKKAGSDSQDAERPCIKIEDPIRVGDQESYIELLPDDAFSISYTIDYPLKCIGRQTFNFVPEEMSFEEDVAPARTFCLKAEAEELLRRGLGQGANLENTLVLENSGPVGTTFRFDDEPVRHKVLDLLGDMYMLARPLQCRVRAVRSGHRLNAELVNKIYEQHFS